MANVNPYESEVPGDDARAMPGRDALTVDRISVPKPQVVLADHLRQKILAGTIAEVSRCPPSESWSSRRA
jgi:hypothetical protein